MTYEELKSAIKDQNSIILAASRHVSDLQDQYIDEHRPADIKPNQHITVRMRITEESRKLSNNKIPVGHVYTIKGSFYSWRISKRGEVIPALWIDGRIGDFDELISVEIDKDQPSGECAKCLHYKDGKCFRNGGKEYPDLGEEIKSGSLVCPRYEEVITGGLDDAFKPGTNYPNVTKMTDKHGKSVYHFYSQNYSCFIERDAKEVEKSIKRNGKINRDSKL